MEVQTNTPKNSSRRSYSVHKKCEVVEWHRKHGRNVSSTASEFGIDRKRIREWNRKYDELKEYDSTPSTKQMKRLHGGSEPASVALDDAVFAFLESLRRDGRRVTNAVLRSKAKQVADELGMKDFCASVGWLYRWKNRYRVEIRRKTSELQQEPENKEDEHMHQASSVA